MFRIFRNDRSPNNIQHRDVPGTLAGHGRDLAFFQRRWVLYCLSLLGIRSGTKRIYAAERKRWFSLTKGTQFPLLSKISQTNARTKKSLNRISSGFLRSSLLNELPYFCTLQIQLPEQGVVNQCKKQRSPLIRKRLPNVCPSNGQLWR